LSSPSQSQVSEQEGDNFISVSASGLNLIFHKKSQMLEKEPSHAQESSVQEATENNAESESEPNSESNIKD
jgi:hypothetical protein